MMAVMGGEPFDEFERWFTATGWNHDDERVRAWFRAFFGRWGPVSADVVEVGWQLDQLASTGRAVDVVLADLYRSSPKRPIVVVDVDEWGSVRVTVDGSYTTPSVYAAPSDAAEVLREVAEYLQDQVLDNHGPVWPTCGRHEFGLHAELVDGRAVWRCRHGDHSVAEIGELPVDPRST